jgi:hypothetical protein
VSATLDTVKLARARLLAQSLLAGVQALEETMTLPDSWEQERADGYLNDLIVDLETAEATMTGTLEDFGEEMIP